MNRCSGIYKGVVQFYSLIKLLLFSNSYDNEFRTIENLIYTKVNKPTTCYNVMLWFIFFILGSNIFALVSLLKLTTTLQKLTRQRKLKLVARINQPQQCVYLKSEKAKATISLLKPWTLILKNHKCTSHHTYVHVSDITQIHPRVLR